MMKETNIHSQVTSTIAGDDGEAMAKSEGYVAENADIATCCLAFVCDGDDRAVKVLWEILGWYQLAESVISHAPHRSTGSFLPLRQAESSGRGSFPNPGRTAPSV